MSEWEDYPKNKPQERGIYKIVARWTGYSKTYYCETHESFRIHQMIDDDVLAFKVKREERGHDDMCPLCVCEYEAAEKA